jgi:archaellum component FlaC
MNAKEKTRTRELERQNVMLGRELVEFLEKIDRLELQVKGLTSTNEGFARDIEHYEMQEEDSTTIITDLHVQVRELKAEYKGMKDAIRVFAEMH